MIKHDGRPTIVWTGRPKANVPPRVAKDREQYKRELAERTKRQSLDVLK